MVKMSFKEFAFRLRMVKVFGWRGAFDRKFLGYGKTGKW